MTCKTVHGSLPPTLTRLISRAKSTSNVKKNGIGDLGCDVPEVAIFIVQKILSDDEGLKYICATAERFFAVGSVLQEMVQSIAESPSPLLLKYIICCYQRLSDNPRACDALRNCLPDMLRDGTFNAYLRE
ncbi:hypothetical protein QJS10_CPA09g00721 [Acorus calamus]|uniref:CCR4-NOT transcription complex subunit 9 n=1 Tax=Acorus calamus TaxID=4465 RepID=A0AAV9E7L0_ACOCL|nr:hypothetical protein QJS10_CPA09g00721 [Acorus calamus]